MNSMTRPKKSPPDPVDRAVASARAAVGRLIQLLCGADGVMVEKAAGALVEIGPFCVGPLAAALPRAESPRDRLVILGAMLTFAPQAKVAVGRALNAALKREQDLHVRAAVQ